MNIYRDEDIQAITDNLDQIIDEALLIRDKKLHPLLDDFLKVKELIKEFINKKKRIIYGGFALHTLIGAKDVKDQFYKTNERSDIEFYTPEPIQDIVDLCNLFHEKKFPYVSGGPGHHEETYTIFVDFVAVCDMSYMPKNVYGNMPVINIDGLLYPDQSWILVDMFRQYNDPILSYRRLKDKVFFRTNLLLKHYPLQLNSKKPFEQKIKLISFKEQIFNKISSMETIIFTGSIAVNYYLTLKNTLSFNNMEIFSLNFKEDIKIIYKYIETILGDRNKEIQIDMYRPFFQFWDDHIEFILNDTCLLKIYGNNGICLPYNNLFIANSKIEKLQTGGFYKDKDKDKNITTPIKIATFILVFNHLLINRQYHYINRSASYKRYEYIMQQLLNKRKEYLTDNLITVMDNSPYREFIVRCSGETIDVSRKFRLSNYGRRTDKKQCLFRYDPSTAKEDYKTPEIIFKNTSGNIYKNGPEKV